MFLTSFNNMFAFFMAALIPIPALRSFSLQVCANWIKALDIVRGGDHSDQVMHPLVQITLTNLIFW